MCIQRKIGRQKDTCKKEVCMQSGNYALLILYWNITRYFRYGDSKIRIKNE